MTTQAKILTFKAAEAELEIAKREHSAAYLISYAAHDAALAASPAYMAAKQALDAAVANLESRKIALRRARAAAYPNPQK